MRRAHFDSGSQPVRNQCLNPRWESVGVSGIIRTNLCTNPGIEAVGGVAITVRTNLATRPRMLDTSLGGYGSQTLTTVTGISGHPDNITTAVRVSYTAGAGNPGAMIMLNPAVSTKYALTAWVYNEGTVTEPMSIALQGEASAAGVGIAPGVWTRLQWVMTSSATQRSGFGVRIGTPTADGSFLVTGITIELQPEPVAYFFDGNSVSRPDGGNLTYSWTGAVGLSTSLQQGITCPSYVGANNAVTYRVGTAGVDLQARTHFTNTVVTDSGVALGLTFSSVAPSKTYTLSLDITTSIDRTMKLSIQGAGVTGATLTFAHTAGVKVRRSITFSTNSSATSGNVALYVLRNDLLLGTFDIDNVLIEEASFANTYFDGSTAATNDFTHSWSGTANASISRQSAVAIAYANTTGTGNKITYMCSERPALHNKFIRMVIDTTNSVGLNTTDTIMPAGVKRTNLFWLRTSRAMTIQVRYRDTSGAFVSNGPIITTNANEWQLWRISDKPTAAHNQHLSLLVASPNGAVGDVVDLGPHMVVEGEYTGDYLDGTKAFSKWYGAADVSESVGYPPQLLDIVGKPILDFTSSGVFNLDDSFASNEPRTFYTVYQTLLASILQSPILTYGVTGLGDSPANQTMMLRLQMNGALVGALNRRTGGAGPVSYNLPAPGTSVTAWGMNTDGLQFVRNNNNGLLSSGQVMDVPHQQIGIWANSSSHKHIRTIAFRGFHDPTTQAAVSRYLGNKYGAYVT